MGEGDGDLRRVGAGLRLVLMGLGATAVASVAAMVVATTMAGPVKEPAAVVLALRADHPSAWTALLGLSVLASVLGIAGKGLCLAVPAEAGATPLIAMAVVCDVLYLALFVVGQSAEPGQAGADLAQSTPLFLLVGYVAFIRFLRRLAEYLGSSRLEARAKRVQSATLALFVTFLTGLALAAVGAEAAAMMAIFVVCVGLLALFVLFARLVDGARRAADAAAVEADEAG